MPEGLDDLPADEPVDLLNLMKFRAESLDGNGTGRDAYGRYGELAMPEMASRGGKVLWAGDIGGVPLLQNGDGDWDFVALVRYPAPSVFLDAVQSDAYQEAAVHRVNGCEKYVILASKPMFGAL